MSEIEYSRMTLEELNAKRTEIRERFERDMDEINKSIANKVSETFPYKVGDILYLEQQCEFWIISNIATDYVFVNVIDLCPSLFYGEDDDKSYIHQYSNTVSVQDTRFNYAIKADKRQLESAILDRVNSWIKID